MTVEASLRDRVAALAAGTPGAARTDTADGARWAIEGVEFATVAGDEVELRLDHAIAAAAARTPDTTIAKRGSEWVRFAPAELDPHAVDRLEAWFGLAVRRARE